MRIVIVTGKGGVGKTCVAAATGLKAAQRGLRTLVMSTDPAHSLGDSFDLGLGPNPLPVAPNLWGLEVDTRREITRHWKDIQEFIRKTIQARGIDAVLAEEVSVFPGMDELFSLLLLKEFFQSGRWDLVVVDCAPTADTIRGLSFPEVGSWYLRKIFPIQKSVVGMIRPLAGKLYDIDLPGEAVFENIRTLIQSLEGMKAILGDPSITSVRFVLNLEKMVIKEIQRAYTYMNIFGFNVDAVFVNKVLPPEVTDPYLARWKRIQAEHLEVAESCFSPVPLFRAPLFDEEMVGLPMLGKLASTLFGDTDPAGVFLNQPPIRIQSGNGECVLQWRIPDLKKEEVNLCTRGEELILNTPMFQRNLFLPRVLVGKKLREARVEADHLLISFEE